MRTISVGKILVGTLGVLLVLSSCFWFPLAVTWIQDRIGELQAQQSAAANQPPTATPTPNFRMDGAAGGVNPAQTPTPPADGSNTEACVSIAEFQQMWNSTDPNKGPGDLILLLNREWEKEMPANAVHCWASETGPWEVPPGAFVWTDLLNTVVRTKDGSKLEAGDFVPLRVQGNWGVFYAYDWLVIETPGRSANSETFLNPEKDLKGWGNPTTQAATPTPPPPAVAPPASDGK